jgi:nicotinamide riboside kinase
LCEALAAHYKTAWVPEYAREYFHDSDIYNYTEADLVTIAKKQIEHEMSLEKGARKYLFCDTTLVTLKIWAELEFGRTPAFIEESLPKINYHHYFITDNDLPWMQDALRQNKFSRELLKQMNINEVIRLGGSYSIIHGKEEERLKNAIAIIDKLSQR